MRCNRRNGKDRARWTIRFHVPFLLALALSFGVFQAKAVSAAELLMIEQAGCHWCAAWNRDVGVVYDKTAEGKRAPLRRIDLKDDIPDDLAAIRIERFTPSFILVDDGREIGRIRGYPGEDFFWGLLGQMIEKLPGKTSDQENTSS